MSRLNLTAKLSLDQISEGWTNEHFLKFRVMDGPESAALARDMAPLGREDNESFLAIYAKYAKQLFVDGKVLVNGETVDAEVDDIDDLPAILTTRAFELYTRSKFDDPKGGKN